MRYWRWRGDRLTAADPGAKIEELVGGEMVPVKICGTTNPEDALAFCKDWGWRP